MDREGGKITDQMKGFKNKSNDAKKMWTVHKIEKAVQTSAKPWFTRWVHSTALCKDSFINTGFLTFQPAYAIVELFSTFRISHLRFISFSFSFSFHSRFRSFFQFSSVSNLLHVLWQKPTVFRHFHPRIHSTMCPNGKEVGPWAGYLRRSQSISFRPFQSFDVSPMGPV